AVAAGIVNAGLIFPSLKSVTDTDYGSVLIIKVIVVALTLAVAAYHWRTLRTSIVDIPRAMLRTLRVELGLILAALLLASTLAMLAPPVKGESGELPLIDLAEPTTTQFTLDQVYGRLQIDPGKAGANTLTAWATQGPPFQVVTDSTTGVMSTVNITPLADVQLIKVTFTSLTHMIAPLEVDLTATGDGKFTGTGLNLPVKDWWRATMTIRRTGVAVDLTAVMYLRLPDPNIEGWDTAMDSVSGSNPQAQAIFTQASTNLASQPWVFFRQNLAGGQGGVEILTQTWSNGGIKVQTPKITIIRLDGYRYLQQGGGEWAATTDAPPGGPTEWVKDVAGATQFQLGNIEIVNGVQAQIVHFTVPTNGVLASAFYTWWVDTATGHVLQEAMVSNSHYMIQTFDWSAPPPTIVAPIKP
ncbi:MAG TPA: CopD family protein, partial [Thermomicrobiales bacterium]|nr:CopD family protein [Thermomicrobiales bacterium]